MVFEVDSVYCVNYFFTCLASVLIADIYYNIYKDKDLTESAKRYYANCTWLDDGVGVLISYLREKGEFENTLFVYVNDNGWEQNPDFGMIPSDGTMVAKKGNQSCMTNLFVLR